MKSLKYSYPFKCLGVFVVLIVGVGIGVANSQQQPQPKEYVLRFTPDDVNVIGKALGKLPFDEVATVIQGIRAQIIDQQTPKQPVTPKEAEPPK